MRVLFALLAFAAVSVSAATFEVTTIEGDLTKYNIAGVDPVIALAPNPNFELDINTPTVFKLVNVSSLHPFGFANPNVNDSIIDAGATVDANCVQPVAEVFAWYAKDGNTTCTVTLPAVPVNGTEVGYRCANHDVMNGILLFTNPAATSTAQDSTGLNPSPIDSSSGAAGSSTGGATPVPTPTPKPGAAAAQVSGVVGLAVALISALVL